MFKNRFLLVIGMLSLLLVTMAVSRPLIGAPSAEELSWPLRPVIAAVVGGDHPNLVEARPYTMDSATRSYIAWGKEVEAEHNAVDSATRSYIAQGKAIEAERNAIDSATRSYIAWGKALEAAGKLGDSGACSNTTQEDIFAGKDKNLDSATRSYIAWGLALQAKDDIRVLCR